MARTSARTDPIQAAIDAIPTEALACRRLRSHDWNDAGESVTRGIPKHHVYVIERCRRGCGVGRAAWWDVDSGRRLSPWVPKYPKDDQGRELYLIPGGLPDEARWGLQRDYLRRLRA